MNYFCNQKQTMRVSIITLGCSKNTVDSEKLAGILTANGFEVLFETTKRCEVVIINTCGFILDSQEESIDTIMSCIQMKQNKRYKLNKIYVFGCLVVGHEESLKEMIPEVDGWYGVNDVDAFAENMMKDMAATKEIEIPSFARYLSTPQHYAYLKISEGCNKFCSFCAIPNIRGRHISRKKEDIVNEAKFLAESGVQEVILIAQDLTYYGKDLYNSLELCDLVKQISQLGFKWIRLHYAHPNEINDDILNLYNEVPNLCKYIDIPLQHISTPILKSMKRNIDKEGTYALIKRIREIVKDIAIRTTFIVGYPGETEEQFNELVDFVTTSKFDRVGVFTFSPEENTAANLLEDNIPDDEKERRKDILLSAQNKIAMMNNENMIGKNVDVIIDFNSFEGYYIGRTQFDSPEVDNEVTIYTDKQLKLGNIYNVTITEAFDYDLEATY